MAHGLWIFGFRLSACKPPLLGEVSQSGGEGKNAKKIKKNKKNAKKTLFPLVFLLENWYNVRVHFQKVYT